MLRFSKPVDHIKEDITVNMQTIRNIAKERGLKSSRLNKAALIRTIQLDEGNFDCFGSIVDYCDQQQCSWRDDCVASSSKRNS